MNRNHVIPGARGLDAYYASKAQVAAIRSAFFHNHPHPYDHADLLRLAQTMARGRRLPDGIESLSVREASRLLDYLGSHDLTDVPRAHEGG